MPTKQYTNLLLALEEYKVYCKKSYQELEKRLQIEEAKNKHLLSIVKKHLKLKASDVFEEKNGELHLYSIDENGNKIEKEKRTSYRSLVNSPYVPPTEEKLVSVDTTRSAILSSHFSETPDVPSLFSSFEKFPTSAQLVKIRKEHFKLIGKLPLDKYIESVRSQIEKTKSICVAKHFSEAKTEKLLPFVLTPLDARLIMFDKYYNTEIDADDILKFRLALDLNIEHQKKYIPYDRDKLFKQFHNYSLALFPIFDIISRNIINPYGFSSIVFMENEKRDEGRMPSSLFSFYTLSKTEENKRCWKIDYRLQEFSSDLATNIRTYAVFLFREIYFHVFKDNIYRSNYKDGAFILANDVVQILNNLNDVLYPKKFCLALQNIVASIRPSEQDKVNLKMDDKINKTTFEALKDDVDYEKTELIKQLFDSITKEQIEEFSRNLS